MDNDAFLFLFWLIREKVKIKGKIDFLETKV